MSPPDDQRSMFYLLQSVGVSQTERDLGTVLRYRHGGQVKRYHTWPTLREQSVAAHSYGVAMIIMALTDGSPSQWLLMAALAHDIAEAWTGDMPAVVKWRSPALKEALDAEEEGINSALNLNFEHVLEPYERLLLKAADMLELMFTSYDERALGNQNMDHIFQNGYNWMREHVAHEAQSVPIARARHLSEYLACRYVIDLNGRCDIKDPE